MAPPSRKGKSVRSGLAHTGSDRRPQSPILPAIATVSVHPLETFGDPGVKRSTRPELRRTDADPGAIANFVNSIEDIDDRKSQIDAPEGVG